jgi:hypothetical protein
MSAKFSEQIDKRRLIASIFGDIGWNLERTCAIIVLVINMEREHMKRHEQAWLRAIAILSRKQLKQCTECGEEFIALHGRQKYCSRRCRQRRAMREYFRRKRERERVDCYVNTFTLTKTPPV